MERAPPCRLTARAVWIVLGNTLAAGALLATAWSIRTVLSWALVALLLALATEPAVRWLTRRGLRPGWAVLLVALGAIVAVGTLLTTLVPLLVAQGSELYRTAPEILEKLKETRPVRWADLHFGVVERVEETLREQAAGIARPALAAASTILHGFVGVASVLALTAFMLLFGREVFESGLTWVEPSRRLHLRRLATRMRRSVGGYVAGTFLVSSIGGAVMGVTTLSLGVPYFLPLALVMVVLGVIPFLGSALGAVLVVGVTFATSGVREGLVALGIYLVYQQLENHFLQPMVQRRTIRMNPLLITLAMLAGTSLLGVLGAAVALPLAGAAQVLLQDARSRREARWATRPGPASYQLPLPLPGAAPEERPRPH